MKSTQKGVVVGLIIILLLSGSFLLWRSFQKPTTNSETTFGTETKQQSVTQTVSTTDLKTYSNPEDGIIFQYPAKYLNSAPSGELPFFQYKDSQKTNSSVSDSIGVYWLPFKSGDSSEQTLINDVFYDGSGAHPKSFDDFTLVHLGDNDFYKIRTGLFEGVLGYRYYLLKDGGAFVFRLTSNGVPWTDPSFDPEKDARHLELREMLKTVKLSF